MEAFGVDIGDRPRNGIPSASRCKPGQSFSPAWARYGPIGRLSEGSFKPTVNRRGRPASYIKGMNVGGAGNFRRFAMHHAVRLQLETLWRLMPARDSCASRMTSG